MIYVPYRHPRIVLALIVSLILVPVFMGRGVVPHLFHATMQVQTFLYLWVILAFPKYLSHQGLQLKKQRTISKVVTLFYLVAAVGWLRLYVAPLPDLRTISIAFIFLWFLVYAAAIVNCASAWLANDAHQRKRKIGVGQVLLRLLMSLYLPVVLPFVRQQVSRSNKAA
jgi:hypothetical protein